MQLTFGCRKAAGRHNFMGRQIAIKMSPMSLMNPALHEQNHQSTMRADPLPYLSGIMGNERLTFFIVEGLCRDYTTPKG